MKRHRKLRSMTEHGGSPGKGKHLHMENNQGHKLHHHKTKKRARKLA